jgi:hypothetical protein
MIAAQADTLLKLMAAYLGSAGEFNGINAEAAQPNSTIRSMPNRKREKAMASRWEIAVAAIFGCKTTRVPSCMSKRSAKF